MRNWTKETAGKYLAKHAGDTYKGLTYWSARDFWKNHVNDGGNK